MKKLNRRHFFRIGVSGAAGISLLPAIGAGSKSSNKKIKPIIMSTWDHGKMANDVGFELLMNGGNSLDAVEQGVRVVESDPKVKTVGIGGFPDRDGIVTLDACIMKGDGSCGAVAFLQDIENPISVARMVMEKTPHVFLVGNGARQFALNNGFIEKDLLTNSAKNDYENWLKNTDYKPLINIENHDTISTLAIDLEGKISGACTTSGAAWKMHGRVGDSPIIGAGLYVDQEVGGACATGWGEEVIRNAGSAMVVEMMRNGKTPQEACEEIVRRIINKSPNPKDIQVGFMAMDIHGNVGAYSIQRGFTYAVKHEGADYLKDANFEMK